jgi:hypothetical protein
MAAVKVYHLPRMCEERRAKGTEEVKTTEAKAATLANRTTGASKAMIPTLVGLEIRNSPPARNKDREADAWTG